jgi:hypothetical protein
VNHSLSDKTPLPRPYPRNAVIVDLDGTAALHHGREWFDYDALETDALCPVVDAVVYALAQTGHTIVILTGRPERYRPHTERWLRAHDIPHSELIMRADTDRRGNAAYKREALAEIRTRHNVVLALEDNPAAVDMFRDEGVVTFHVRVTAHDERKTPHDNR